MGFYLKMFSSVITVTLSAWIYCTVQVLRYSFLSLLGFQTWNSLSIKCNPWNCSGLLDRLSFAYGQKCISSNSWWFSTLHCHCLWWWVFEMHLRILIRYTKEPSIKIPSLHSSYILLPFAAMQLYNVMHMYAGNSLDLCISVCMWQALCLFQAKTKQNCFLIKVLLNKSL